MRFKFRDRRGREGLSTDASRSVHREGGGKPQSTQISTFDTFSTEESPPGNCPRGIPYFLGTEAGTLWKVERKEKK